MLRRRAVRSAARALQSRARLCVWIAAAPASKLASTNTFTSPGVVAGEVVHRNADQTIGEVNVISSRETDRAVSTGPRYGLGAGDRWPRRAPGRGSWSRAGRLRVCAHPTKLRCSASRTTSITGAALDAI